MNNSNFSFLILVAIGFVVFFIVRKVLKRFKTPKIGCMALVTGGVKAGKSTFAVHLAIKQYKRAKRSVRLRNYFRKAFGRQLEEEPLLYSNIPLAVPYVQLTEDMLLRKVRFRYKSVIYVNEASLLADSQLCKDMDVNERLQFFNKLIGHETKGGYLIYDTQAIGDLHYSIKRCLSEYFYIHHIVKWIPFFLVAYVREDRYSDDGTFLSVGMNDTEETLKRVIVPKSTWKKFDCYCYSVLTDELPVADKVIELEKGDSLKVGSVVSFRDYKSLDPKFKGVKKNA